MTRLPLLALALALGATGCTSSASMNADLGADMDGMSADAGVMVGGEMMLPTRTLPDNASRASNLTTLVAAVEAAGLVETLAGPGPFTVFAPTNAAFADVPEATLNSLLEPANRAQLQAVLTYHVVPGRILASQLRDGQRLTTVNGETLVVTKANGMVMVGGATVVQADVHASNGVAHVIDTVLVP